MHSTKDSDSGNSRKSSVRLQSSSVQKVKKKSWKEWFVEMHVREYLMKLKPQNYDAEKVMLRTYSVIK